MAWATKTLTVCTEANPDGFDVVQYNALVTTNASADPLMNRLVEYDTASGHVLPSLAARWSISADGRTYTFYLRHDVGFHHTDYFNPTRKFNARDVVFSFERMLNPANPWYRISSGNFPHATAMQFPTLIASVRALDAYTNRPFCPRCPWGLHRFIPMNTRGNSWPPAIRESSTANR
jgi:ABC-type transport system substrate-binding protein